MPPGGPMAVTAQDMKFLFADFMLLHVIAKRIEQGQVVDMIFPGKIRKDFFRPLQVVTLGQKFPAGLFPPKLLLIGDTYQEKAGVVGLDSEPLWRFAVLHT